MKTSSYSTYESGISQQSVLANPTKKLIKAPTLKWSIRSMSGCPRDRTIAQIICGSSTFIIYICFTTIFWEIFLEDHSFFFTTQIFFICLGSCLVGGARQKTTYRYSIYQTRARLVHQVYYSKFAKYTIKTIVSILMFILALAGLMSGSVLLIIFPIASYFVTALYLFNLYYPVNRETSLPWHEYNFVTIDRKHRFVITHRTDPTVGFEARLPNDELFEQYLAFLRTVLPAHVTYTEKRWEWSLI